MLRLHYMETHKEKLARARRKRLNILLERYGKQVVLAEALDAPPTFINHLLTGHRGMGEEVARKYERKLSLPAYWFDADAEDENNPRNELHALLDLVSEDDIDELKVLLEMTVRRSRRTQGRQKPISRKSAG